MMTKQNKLIAAVAVLVALGGGWLYAKHQAAAVARDKIDGFIIRHNLTGTVSYQGLSASPFGSVTLSGVWIRISPTSAVTIGSVAISDVEMKYDQLRGIAIAASGVEVPLLALAKEQRNTNEELSSAIGMGYTTLSGDLGLALHYDDQRGTLAFQTSGSIKEAGSWTAKLSLAGIDPAGINTLYGMASTPAQANALALLDVGGKGILSLATITLTEAELSVDNAGVYKRNSEVTDQDLPPDDGAAGQQTVSLDELELVRAGMTPSEAQASHAAVDNWLKKGGSLRIATNLAQPLPLFRNGNFFTPAFTSPASFLAATKVRVSN